MSSLFIVSHLSKRYKGEDKYVLDDLSFSLPSKGLISIAGKSGCGKSTLLHLLLGLLKPSRGKIYYRKKNIDNYDRKSWIKFRRYESSIIFQHYNLIEDQTGLYNVMLPMLIAGKSHHKARKRALELLNRFHLEHLAEKKVRVLSGGEKQRIAICRSLSMSPSVIFADEPTGALDSANSILVMEMLQEIAKTSLVVMVSHNMELVEQYSDRLILLKNGKIEMERIIHPHYDENDQNTPKQSIHDGHWIGIFLRHNLKRHPVSIVVRISSTFIGFLAVLFSVGFACGNGPALEQEKKNTLDYCSFRLVEREYVEVPSSPLRLIKQSRPSFDGADEYLFEMPSASLHLDYSYFLPSSMPFDLDGERQDPARLLPIYDPYLNEHGSDLIIESLDTPFDETHSCIVNRQFIDEFHASVGQTIYLSYDAVIVYEGSKETVSTRLDFTIHSVVREFEFLNSPKIYYSYPMIDRFYGEYELENFPSKNGRRQTVSTFLQSVPGDTNYTNYDYLVFSHGASGTEDLVTYLQNQGEDGLMLESDAYDIATSFFSLASALLTSLMLFMAISIISLVLIIAVNAFSSFLAQKKQSAVLLSLGAKRSDIIMLVSMEGILLSLISIGLVIPFSFLGQSILSKVLEGEFGIPNLIQIPYQSLWGIPFLLIPLLLLCGIVISLLSSAIPLLIAGRIDLAEALKEE